MKALRWARMLAHAVAAVLILRFIFPRVDARARRGWVGAWSAKLVRIMGLATSVRGTPPSDVERGAMIACNHVSWLDMFVISGVRPTRFIAKSEIRDWPMAGWIAEKAGTIFIRRQVRRDTARINAVVHEALQNGDCVGLFPEGTTSEGESVLKFHSSLFEAAVANGAHVHPCAIRYERPDGSLCRQMAFVGELSFMQSLGLAIRQRGVVARLCFGDPIDTAGLDRREVARRAYASVASLLRPSRDRAPTPPGDPPAASP
jgi:1-acyl-sn-glycerol-3-phosphate acyltransferase